MTQSTPPAAKPPTEGLVAGNYRLVRLIGKGGMGSVWEAQHHRLNTRVAIKFIETEHAVSQEARSRFEKEAVAAATIQSKHAIQIFDHGVTAEGIPFIIMEMLQGESLERRVERLSRLSLQETAKIILQCSRALARAHERGIIHRDLKPDNVFVVRDADDGEEIAKVLDFGIAKMQGVPGSPGMTSSTKTGSVLGTPFYMSPEQARGLRNVDHRTDLWSLGVIAFRCVTGKLPFDGESVGDLLVKICTTDPPIPSQVVPGVPPGFDRWFMRAMDREPARRFQTAMDLANELCFVAGIAQAGQGMPMSQQTAHVSTGPVTPNGYGQSSPAHSTPSHSTPNHHPSNHPPHAHIATPNPHTHASASATNSPFTTGLTPAGVPSGGKGKAVGLTIALLLVGAVGTAAFFKLKKPTAPAPIAAASAAVSTPPSAVPPEAKPPEEAKPADPPKHAAADTHPEPKAEKVEAKVEKADPKPVAKVATKPIAPPATSAKPPPSPPPPAPVAPPKPRKDDPGY